MSMGVRPDAFIVVNGPQDGTEFPIMRAPFNIGQDSTCAVNVRLDGAVRGFHATASQVGEFQLVLTSTHMFSFVLGQA